MSFTVESANAASWTSTGALKLARQSHTTTLLLNGQLLIAGGVANTLSVTNGAELYDPATGATTATGLMTVARFNHTSTLLLNGKVLVAGGLTNGTTANTSDLYDPATGSWAASGPMNLSRCFHTATLLRDGRVLVAGGSDTSGVVTNSAEVYDPVTKVWTLTGPMGAKRFNHTATMLPNGRVLVVGGNGATALSSSELYDPATGMWSPGPTMNTARFSHTATLLPNGAVLAAGGAQSNGVETDSAELYNPATQNWTPTGSLGTKRFGHTATLLPNGNVMVAGGFSSPDGALSSVEVYDRLAGSWSTTNALNTKGFRHTTTLLPNGTVLVVGGSATFGVSLDRTETFDPAAGSWATTGSLDAGTALSGASVLLPNGNVLFSRVRFGPGGFLTNVDLYNPTLGTWTATNGMSFARNGHTATLLCNGKVIVIGGNGDSFWFQAEVYDPTPGTWRIADGTLNDPHTDHTATLLNDGRVLVAGGLAVSITTPVAELYDPASDRFRETGSMKTAREGHTATLLATGKSPGNPEDLLAEELPEQTAPNCADANTGLWTPTDPLPVSLYGHSAVLLPNGKVLITGGFGPGNIVTNIAVVFDPASGTNGKWTAVSPMNVPRRSHSSTLLRNGKVLVAGGQSATQVLPDAEIFDPATGKWTVTAPLSIARLQHKTTLLTNGFVLVACGEGTNFSSLTNSELYNPGLGFNNAWQPQIATLPARLTLGDGLAITGANFRGASEGSGGNGFEGSSSDCPVVQLRSVENGRVAFLASTNWQTNSFVSLPVTNFPAGNTEVTVFVNGIPSASGVLSIAPRPIAFSLTNPVTLDDGSFQFAFTNAPGTTFSVLVATNISPSLNNWGVLGDATEISSGQFQFTDSEATNRSRRLYRVRSQ